MKLVYIFLRSFIPEPTTRFYKYKETLWRVWRENKSEQFRWKVYGWKWKYEPFWYLREEDSDEKGARCADCNKFIERKDENSLQIHEFHHWD